MLQYLDYCGNYCPESREGLEMYTVEQGKREFECDDVFTKFMEKNEDPNREKIIVQVKQHNYVTEGEYHNEHNILFKQPVISPVEGL